MQDLKQLIHSTKSIVILTRFLLVVSVAICVVALAFLISTPFYLQAQMDAAPDFNKDLFKSVFSLKALQDYQASVDAHPLFGRRRAEMVAPSVSPCDTFASKYVLVGIVQGVENEALIKSKLNRQTSFVKKAEEIEGVRIEEVTTSKIIISCSGIKKDLLIEGEV